MQILQQCETKTVGKTGSYNTHAQRNKKNGHKSDSHDDLSEPCSRPCMASSPKKKIVMEIFFEVKSEALRVHQKSKQDQALN
jgi:hypothetical protein